ncbi:MFS transporter [Alicyclobacillaceae bacterium I2511]|nr:MFS transporter [Alicyclobacillaceae bacterium I2511]
MQKSFDSVEFPARVGPIPYLGMAFMSQTGMSFVQQGLVILGTFFLFMYHLNLTELGFITTSLSLGVMVSMAFVGVVVDRFGPRVVLFWGAVLMAGFSLLLLRVQKFGVLLATLFFIGVTLAIVPSAGTKAVFTAFADRPRGLVMGIRQTGVPVGAALAAWLLPQMVPHLGMHWVYVAFAIELWVTGWAFSAVMPAWHRVSVVGDGVRLRREHWVKLSRPALVAFLMVSGQYILLTYSIADLHQAHHLTVAMAGAVLALSQIGGGVGRIVLGQVSDYLGGRRAPVIAFTASLGAIMAFFVGLLPGTVSVWLLFVLWIFFGFAAVGWNALALTWAGESVPASHSGLAMSLTGSIVFLGSSIFPPLFGIVVDTSHRLAFGWWLLAGILALAAFIAWQAAKRTLD